MDYKTMLHEVIKKKFIEVAEREGEAPQIDANYHLKDPSDNLVVPMAEKVLEMYRNGNGNELNSKMSSIRSSAAMTFNLLGNGPVEIKSGSHAGKYNLIEYEYRLETLKNNPKKEPHPAHLDAYLEGENEDIYCEMKMFEWLLSSDHKLRPAYLEAENYLVPRKDADCFSRLFRNLVHKKGQSGELFSEGRYDCLQMAKHLLAIYNKVAKPDYKPKRVTLLNCVWEFTHPEVLEGYEGKYSKMLDEEHEGFEKFKELATELVVPLFEAKGVPLSIEYITASELMESIAYEEPIRRKLERYIV